MSKFNYVSENEESPRGVLVGHEKKQAFEKDTTPVVSLVEGSQVDVKICKGIYLDGHREISCMVLISDSLIDPVLACVEYGSLECGYILRAEIVRHESDSLVVVRSPRGVEG